MPVNTIFSNFQFGELSPLASGRPDLPIGTAGVELLLNFIMEPQGPIRFRNGSRLVYHTKGNKVARLIPFQFSDAQSYQIEVTDMFFRFYKDGAIIVESAVTISGVTKANPAVVTATGHGYSNGDEVIINDVAGMTQLNGKSFIVANKTTNTFELTDIWGANVNSSAYDTYTSGGQCERVYQIATPYAEADIETLQFTQNADTMYIVAQGYAPRKLTRSGHTNWTLGTYARTDDPFASSGNYPRTGSFLDDGRLMMAGTINKPETLNASRSPDNVGAVRYDDYTTGVDADHAVSFTLAPIQGKVDAIQWITNTDKFVAVGTFGSIRRVFGATVDTAIGPGSVTAKSVNTYGAALAAPASTGTVVFYIRRGRKQIRSIEYDFALDGYRSVNRNLGADHLTKSGVKQIAYQAATPNILWAVRDDGVLLGYTFEEKEDKAGWHQHRLGGNGKVLWCGITPRDLEEEQLWLIVERVIGTRTYRTIEYIADQVDFPTINDFYSSTDGLVQEQAKRDILDSDYSKYHNALYEKLKQSNHLDMSLVYDGRDTGIAANAALTLSDTTGTITITSDNNVFTSSMVGREIWKAYDSDGEGGGRAEITGYTSATQVTAEVFVDFDNDDEIAAGDWYLTTNKVSGLNYVEGQTVDVVADGAVQASLDAVANNSITLNTQASYIIAGYRYRGLVKSMNLEFGGVYGAAQAKLRRVVKIAIRLLYALGVSVGTDPHRLNRILFHSTAEVASRPAVPHVGYREEFDAAGAWSTESRYYIAQEQPSPCVVLGVDVTGEASDEP